MKKTSSIFGVFLLVLILAAISRSQLSELKSPGLSSPAPYLRAPSHSGPPLSTALPTSGAFSHGLVTTIGRPTGTPIGSGGASRSMLPPIHSRVTPMQAPQPYLPVPNITGQSMARFAVSQGITRGLRF